MDSRDDTFDTTSPGGRGTSSVTPGSTAGRDEDQFE
jgi:hypothetical protein